MNNPANFSPKKITEKGFTLVELLIALFIGLFLIGGAIQIYLSSKQAYDELDRVTYLQENLRYITDTLTREFRHVSGEDTSTWAASDQIVVNREYNCFGSDTGGPFNLTYQVIPEAICNDGVTPNNKLVCSDGTNNNEPVVNDVFSMDVQMMNGVGDCLAPGTGSDPAAGMCLTFILQDTKLLNNGELLCSNHYEVQFTVAFRNRVINLYNNF